MLRHGERTLARTGADHALSASARIDDLLRYQAEGLQAYAVDSAYWDATYAFMDGTSPDEAYLAAALPDPAMAIDILLFFDAAGRLFHREGLSEAGRLRSRALEKLIGPLLPSGEASPFPSGLLRLDDAVVLTAVAPIRTSEGKGPDRGFLVLGRLVDEERLQISRLTGLTMTLTSLAGKTDAATRSKVAELIREGRTVGNSEEGSQAWMLVTDLLGRPAFLASIAIPSEFRARVRGDVVGLVAALVIAFVSLLATTFLLFDRLVLTGLRQMGHEMAHITASPRLHGHLTERGDDEIAQLARCGNALIDALVEARNGEMQTSLLFRSLVDNIPGVVYRSRNDANWTKEYLSDTFEEITGYAVTEYLFRDDRSLAEIIHPDDLPRVRETLSRCHSQGEAYAMTFRIFRADGTTRWLFDRGQFLYDPTTSEVWFDGVMFDVTEERRAQEALTRSENRYRELFENSPLAFCELDCAPAREALAERLATDVGDLDDRCRTHRDEVLEILARMKVLTANGAALKLLSASDAEEIEAGLGRIHGALSPEEIAGRLRMILATHVSTEADEVLCALDGRRIVARTRWVSLPGEAGGVDRLLCALEDITERKALEEKLLHLSLHDALTGLHNRAFFEGQTALCETGRSDPLAVVVVDVDGLKIVNDTLGHDAGDSLLLRAAATLRKSFRESDIVARVGGDEFSVLLPRCSLEGLQAVLERLKRNIDDEAHGPALAPLVLSVGSAWRKEGERTLAQLITDADNAMYAVKIARRGLMTGRFRQRIETELARRDHFHDGHERRLTQILEALGEALGLDQKARDRLGLLARYHDLGKIVVGDDEKDRRRHVEAGARIAQAWSDLAPLAAAIASHHERHDGKGYPRRLARETIPLEGRLLALALAYEKERSGRKGAPLSHEETLERIVSQAGGAFDPALVDLLVSLDPSLLDGCD